jgi:hypothetical protein
MVSILYKRSFSPERRILSLSPVILGCLPDKVQISTALERGGVIQQHEAEQQERQGHLLSGYPSDRRMSGRCRRGYLFDEFQKRRRIEKQKAAKTPAEQSAAAFVALIEKS